MAQAGEFNTHLVMISIEAPSRRELSLLMAINNEVNGKMYNYQFPYKDGDAYGVWFYEDIGRYKEVTLDMINQGPQVEEAE